MQLNVKLETFGTIAPFYSMQSSYSYLFNCFKIYSLILCLTIFYILMFVKFRFKVELFILEFL